MRRIPWDGIFVEHPVRPVPVGDPLSNLAASMPQLDNESPTAVVPRIGYASFWEKVPQRTWSGSAWNLREGLRRVSDTIDVGVEFSAAARNMLKFVHARYRDGRLTTVAGIEDKEWPLPGPVPDGVNLLGALSPGQVARLYDEHDLFVMPPRQESFGVVFTEALSRGLPCVARNAYAMPEIGTQVSPVH